ncbi:hypothetical protein GGTG_10933 [Gaeumannomyces tritici R3-111a-1]|uniref:Uncharacterized protein n=1 Tax=Gaeumannomyces tritici (strain R3-111a-1) TaxID=644352 RepID=J3PBR2_GAET3|nr:hypothetical protein GGTG_10933 [Gaeumannomyces tritici R3-111a-1]EJT71679.1 hypothetical protein GGTG_10933 [Gaeumannomyces tritici R3-111a-1]
MWEQARSADGSPVTLLPAGSSLSELHRQPIKTMFEGRRARESAKTSTTKICRPHRVAHPRTDTTPSWHAHPGSHPDVPDRRPEQEPRHPLSLLSLRGSSHLTDSLQLAEPDPSRPSPADLDCTPAPWLGAARRFNQLAARVRASKSPSSLGVSDS